MSSPIKIKGVKLNDGVTVLADGFYPTATNKVAFADITQNGGANDTTLTAALAGKAPIENPMFNGTVYADVIDCNSGNDVQIGGTNGAKIKVYDELADGIEFIGNKVGGSAVLSDSATLDNTDKLATSKVIKRAIDASASEFVTINISETHTVVVSSIADGKMRYLVNCTSALNTILTGSGGSIHYHQDAGAINKTHYFIRVYNLGGGHYAVEVVCAFNN